MSTRNRGVVALIFYGVALLFLLPALFVARGEGGQYLFEGALICAGGATGNLLVAVWRRRRSADQASSWERSAD